MQEEKVRIYVSSVARDRHGKGECFVKNVLTRTTPDARKMLSGTRNGIYATSVARNVCTVTRKSVLNVW